jgi:protein SCO1/2
MSGRFALLAGLIFLAGCQRHQPISSQYPAEYSAISPVGNGLPFLVGRDFRPAWGPAQEPVRTLPAFKFRDQTGALVSSESLAGRALVVSFFFTACGGVCPTTVHNLHAVQERFRDDDRVLLLSVSVTPDADTPAELAHYARRHGILGNRWKLLTGARDQIYAFARAGFNADTVSPTQNAKKAITPDDFLHSENVYLLDREHKLRGIYAGIRTGAVAELTRDLGTILQ